MVAKKRNTLRGKVAARLGSKPLDIPTITPTVDDELSEDPKAFLHQYKESKKEKQMNKQSAFISKIKQSSKNEFSGISKSSIRRRKRKLRDNLKPRMEDLLTSLKQELDLKEFTTESPNKEDIMTDESTISLLASNRPSSVTRIVDSKKPPEPGSIKIKKNEPNIRNKKGARALSIKESERFIQVLKTDEFKKNSFAALRDIIKLQKH